MTTWRPVPGWVGFYEVSDDGQVRSLPRVIVGRTGKPLPVRGRTLRPTPNEDGYLKVALSRDNTRTTRGVHQIVLEAFVGPAPDGAEACHNNGNPADNRATNLRWDTRSGNRRDRLRHGTDRNASKTHCVNDHPLDDANTYRPPGSTRRQCRACRAAAQRRYTSGAVA